MRIQSKSIEVFGVRFRSHLESCWAMFFQRLNIPWLYEPVKFSYGDDVYIPDFCISLTSNLDDVTWIEIKPPIDRASIKPKYDRFKMAAKEILGHDFRILYGTPLDCVNDINIDHPTEECLFSGWEANNAALQSLFEDVAIYKSRLVAADRNGKTKTGIIKLNKSKSYLKWYVQEMPGCYEAQNALRKISKILSLRNKNPKTNYVAGLSKTWPGGEKVIRATRN